MKLIDLLFLNQSFERNLIKRSQKHHLNYTLKKLQNRGVSLKVVFDVGARIGLWSTSVRKVLKSSDFFLFEATEQCREQLSKSGFKYFINVLSDSEKVVEFYEIGSTGDSYYKEYTSFYQDIKPIEKRAVSLDFLVNTENLPMPDLIKLDTQGSELDILKGAKKVLRDTSLIYIECPVLKYNEGAPTLTDYLDFLRKLGFLPYEICEQHFANDILMQVDIMFIKKTIYEECYPGPRGTFKGIYD